MSDGPPARTAGGAATLFSLAALLLVFGTPALFAEPGTGSGQVSPSSAQAGATGQRFTFTYLAAEAMVGGELGLEVPVSAGWTAPQNSEPSSPGHTTASGGTAVVIGGVLQEVESATGWQPTGGAELRTDTNRIAGNVSLGITTAGRLVRVSYNLPAAADWSSATHVLFWLRTHTDTTAADLHFLFSTSPDLGGTPISLPIEVPRANTWHPVLLALSGERSAVRSFGLEFSASLTSGTTLLDEILIGPISPTVDASGTVNVRVLQASPGGQVAIDYGGVGSGGVSAPQSPGAYTFWMQARTRPQESLVRLVGGSPSITLQAPSTATPTASTTPAPSATATPTPTSTSRPTFTPTAEPSATASLTPALALTPTIGPTATIAAGTTPTPAATPTWTPTPTADSASATSTPSATPTQTAAPTPISPPASSASNADDVGTEDGDPFGAGAEAVAPSTAQISIPASTAPASHTAGGTVERSPLPLDGRPPGAAASAHPALTPSASEPARPLALSPEPVLAALSAVGGAVSGSDGRVRLSVPQRAVAQDTWVVYRPREPDAAGASAFSSTGIVFEINVYSPQGGAIEHFGGPIEIRVDYQSVRPPELDRGGLRVYRFDAPSGAWLPLATLIDRARGMATTATTEPGIFGVFEPLERETRHRRTPGGTIPAAY